MERRTQRSLEGNPAILTADLGQRKNIAISGQPSYHVTIPNMTQPTGWYFDSKQGCDRPTSASVTKEWWVDPINGSDSNTGLNAQSALETIAEIFRRYGSKTPVLTTAVTIWIQNSTNGMDTWTGYRPSTGENGTLLVKAALGGASGKPVFSGAVSGFTAVNPSAGVNAPATLTIEGMNWTPYLSSNFLFHGVASSGDTYKFRVIADLGSGIAQIGTPLTTPVEGFGQYATPVVGDTINIYSQPSIFIDDYQSSENGNGVQFENLDITGVDGTSINSFAQFYWCTFSDTSFMTETTDTNTNTAVECIGCQWNSSTAFMASALLIACVIDGPNIPIFSSRTVLDGDTWIGIRYHYASSGGISLARVGFASIQDVDVGQVNWVVTGSIYGSTRIYGAGFNVATGSRMHNVSSSPYATVMEGLATLQIDGVATACPWTGAGFGAAAAFTPASCDSASQWSPNGSGSYIAKAGF